MTTSLEQKTEEKSNGSGWAKTALGVALLGIGLTVGSYLINKNDNIARDIAHTKTVDSLTNVIDTLDNNVNNKEALNTKVPYDLVRTEEGQYVWTDNARALDQANRDIGTIKGKLVIYDTKFNTIIADVQAIDPQLQSIITEFETQVQDERDANEAYKDTVNMQFSNLKSYMHSLKPGSEGRLVVDTTVVIDTVNNLITEYKKNQVQDTFTAEIPYMTSTDFWTKKAELGKDATTEDILNHYIATKQLTSKDSTNVKVKEHNKEFHGFMRWNLNLITQHKYDSLQTILGGNANYQQIYDKYASTTQVRKNNKFHKETHGDCK